MQGVGVFIENVFLVHCVLTITASSFLAEGCFLALFSYKESGKEFAISLSNRLSVKLVHEQSDDYGYKSCYLATWIPRFPFIRGKCQNT